MLNNEYISKQLQSARRRDFLEAAEASRLAAGVRVPRSWGLPRFAWRRQRQAPVVKPNPCVPSAR